MAVPEVIFAPGLAEDTEIAGALRRIPPGGWPSPVDHLEVMRLLDGGLSSSTVAQVFLCHGGHRLLRVVKVGPAAELTTEWRAYRDLVEPVRNALCAPIMAATPEVVEGRAAHPWDGPAALVYDHVGQHAGAPEEDVRTLEEVVRAATDGGDEAVRVIDELLSGIAHVLHHRYSVRLGPSSLRCVNPGLGPDVTLTVDRLDGELLHYGPFDGRQAETSRLPHDEVLLRSLRGTGLVDGDLLTLGGLRPRKFTGSLIADGDNITVEIQAEPGSGVALAELLGRPRLAVCGRITGSRGARHRERLKNLLELPADDPFAALPQVLTETRAGRVCSVAHGDLNPRNILLTGGRPYLIDYARARNDCPQQTDFCWLEVGLVRDVFAGQGPRVLLGLQRVLGFAMNLLDLGSDAGRIERACLDLLDPESAVAFRVLWAIRIRAHRCYPESASVAWRWDHPRQLLVAAHRTVKWTSATQSEEKLRASAVVAAVATEWIRRPFRYWENARLATALKIATDLLPPDECSTTFYAGLVTAVDSRGPVGGTEGLVRRRREAVFTGYEPTPSPDYFDLTVAGKSVLNRLADRQVLLTGGAGSGKTTVAQEFARRLTGRSPVLIGARDLPGALEIPPERLVLGEVQVIVDGLDDLDPARQAEALSSLRDFRDRYPRAPLVACLRREGDENELHGFPVVHLPPLNASTMRAFLRKGLSPQGPDVELLLSTLLDDPLWQRLDPRRPSVLAAVARHLRDGGSPDTLGILALASDEREFAAARKLLADPATAVTRAGHREWREPCLIFAALTPEVAPVLDMARAIADVDARYAARLLRAAGAELPEFTAAVRTVLCDPGAGPDLWRVATDALRELGGTAGAKALLAAVLDPNADEQARAGALRALAKLHNSTLSRGERQATLDTLASAVLLVLGGPAPVSVRVAALAAAGSADLRGAELLISQYVRPGEPWEVVRQAMSALRELGTVLPETLQKIHRGAAHRRLAVVEEELPAATTAAEVQALEGERAELVSALADTASLPWLLARRFAFGLGDRVADRLDEVLTGDTPAGSTDLAAAHLLLRDAPGRAHELLASTAIDPTRHRLLIAAAALERVGVEGVDLAERLVRRLAPVVGADRLEGLSALVCAIFFADRPRGTRLAWTTAAVLAERDLPERHRWPWATALARTRGTPAHLDAMLGGSDATSASLAIDALASYDFHRSCQRGPHHAFSLAARRRLLCRQPSLETPSVEATQWLLACATVGLTEALPAIESVIPQWLSRGSTPVERGSARFGVIAQAPLADALAITGYLARRADDEDAHRVLREFDPRGHHESVGLGRLIGLAYLGDWQPLVAALPVSARHRAAARNALELWAPGPRTPAEVREPVGAAAWIATLLEAAEAGTPARWALGELRRVALGFR